MPKKMIPAPIDRPLSRAYLRQFTGWSTAYPPGISDPTSLRVMENVTVQRDGSLRVRPGLRLVSYESAPPPVGNGSRFSLDMVGTFEPFFLANGSKAYLFAARDADRVSFWTLADTGDGAGLVVRQINNTVDPDNSVDFEVGPGGVPHFSSATTYVKYLQIDNKIFALSNAGEPMILFTVGATKSAKQLQSVTRPEWTVADKLTVVHPDAAWINSASAVTLRANAFTNPSFEANVDGWLPAAQTTLERSSTVAQAGGWSGRLSSKPTRTNLIRNPIHDLTTYPAFTYWSMGTNTSGLIDNGGYLGVQSLNGSRSRRFFVDATAMDVTEGLSYRVAYNIAGHTNTDNHGVLVRFYSTGGARIGADRLYYFDQFVGRKTTEAIPAPAGAVQMSIHPFANAASVAFASFEIGDVVVCKDGEATTSFTGASGTNYFWTGTAGYSPSVYHPPVDVSILTIVTTAPGSWNASGYFRSSGTGRTCSVELTSGATVDTGTPAADSSGAWTRLNNTITSPAGATSTLVQVKVAAVPRGEYHYVDALLMENVGAVGTYFDGDTAATGTKSYAWTGTPHASPSAEQTFSVGGSIPPPETKTADTLISSTASDNVYNFGFFYTFSTEIGESAASQITVMRAQRGWQQWRWNKPNASGEPDDTQPTGDGDLCADQLAAYLPQAVYDQAVAEGALSWSLYMFTWSDQDPVPVTAVRVGHRDLDPSKTYTPNSWLRATPMMADAGDQTAPLPTKSTRRNYTEPSRGGQGIVASDRMVMVYDPTDQAVIRWTSNNQGSYIDFTAGRGGGYKTLTSGNLYVPACVKLWQNPQSVDTLTILCLGVDGQSTGYYMSPAQVASQSEAVNIMGFEETTATPGTVSPYGVEVMNNALYHPLDHELMKSVASNYNINHSSVTDLIQDQWRGLANKHWIVSSQHDNRLYYLVYNPRGEALRTGCRGNEVWVFDGQAKAGNWSRWLCQGNSLKKIEYGGRVGMSLCTPDGIYFFDDTYDIDDYIDPGNILTGNSATFETGIGDWVPGGNPHAVLSQDSSLGVPAMKIVWQGDIFLPNVQIPVTGLTVGQTYCISAYGYSPTGSPGLYVSEASIDRGAETTVKDDWERFSHYFVATATSHLITILVDPPSTGGEVTWIRNAQLTATDGPVKFSTNPPFRRATVRHIPWLMETNTQGANRAHDAWAHLQQCNVVFGNALGRIRYGVKGVDLHGKPVDVSKLYNAPDLPDDTPADDLEDMLLVRRDMKEWVFYARSEPDPDQLYGTDHYSAGQIDLVQYRYTPSTVNTGYEYGSVETFEYGRDTARVDSNTTNGIPVPMIDTARP